MEVHWQEYPAIIGLEEVRIQPKPAAIDTLRRLFPGCDIHNPPWQEIIQELIEYGGYKKDTLLGSRFVAPLLLQLLAQNRMTRTREELERLNKCEAAIVTAIRKSPNLIGEELAPKAGYPYNSHFRTTLANLVKRGIIENIRNSGYCLPKS